MSAESQTLKLGKVPCQFFLGPLAFTALLNMVLLGTYLWAYRGDISALVCAGIGQIGRWPYEDIHVGFPQGGFDGQIYYLLARDPWRKYDTAVIDVPAQRQGRILYPSLAWALSGGEPRLLLWVLPTINLVAIVILAWLGACLAVHYGRSPWWGALLPLVLNTGMSSLRNLTDPLATVTACGVLTAWLLRWPGWQLAAWSLAAALSREQNYLIVALVLFEALRGRCWGQALWLGGAMALAFSWVITLKVVYGSWPMNSGNVAAPFAGMWFRWNHLEGLSGPLSRPIHIAGMLLLSFQAVLSLALVFFRPSRLAVLVALAGAALAILGGTDIYLNGWSYSRVFLWMPLGIWLWTLESGRRWPALILTSAAIWQVAAVAQAWQS